MKTLSVISWLEEKSFIIFQKELKVLELCLNYERLLLTWSDDPPSTSGRHQCSCVEETTVVDETSSTFVFIQFDFNAVIV